MTIIDVELGPLAKPLNQQLAPFNLPPKMAGVLEIDAKAIERLYLMGILVRSEAENARQRLMHKIQDCVVIYSDSPKNKSKE